jgi:hypothetical protein
MKNIVYDISEISDLPEFVYDVKILYQLSGLKVESFSSLCNDFLDEYETEAYGRLCKRAKAHLRSYAECGIPIQKEFIPAPIQESIVNERSALTDLLFKRFSHDRIISFYENAFSKIKALHAIGRGAGLKFNFVGSRTGRLSFKKKTFNPYTLSKEKRSCIKARPGYKIWEFDLKSCQPRIAIACTYDYDLRQNYLTDDIYAAFKGERKDIKLKFLHWLYSSNPSQFPEFETAFKPIKDLRENVYRMACEREVLNFFARPLYFPKDVQPNAVFQNYITSNEADALLGITEKTYNLLKETQSRILFPFYDALVCEISEDESDLPGKVKKLIENSYVQDVFYCVFPVETKKGDDYAHLEKYDI